MPVRNSWSHSVSLLVQLCLSLLLLSLFGPSDSLPEDLPPWTSLGQSSNTQTTSPISWDRLASSMSDWRRRKFLVGKIVSGSEGRMGSWNIRDSVSGLPFFEPGQKAFINIFVQGLQFGFREMIDQICFQIYLQSFPYVKDLRTYPRHSYATVLQHQLSYYQRPLSQSCRGGLSLHVRLTTRPDAEEYKSILAMMKAVNEVNKDLNLLPNITLGYHIFSTCNDPRNTFGYATNILSGGKEAPNYYCRGRGEVGGFIGESTFHTNRALVQLLSLYRYTQINYRVTDPRLNGGEIYPTLFRMTPGDRAYQAAIIQVLQNFGWNWVGIISDGSSDEEAQDLSKMLREHGICTEYIIHIRFYFSKDLERLAALKKPTSNVIILCGTFTMSFFYLNSVPSAGKKVTFIFPPSWNKLSNLYEGEYLRMNCSLVLQWPQHSSLNINIYPHGVNVSSCLHDPILEDIWNLFLRCNTPNPRKNDLFLEIHTVFPENCSDVKDISDFFSYSSSIHFYAYRAVYVLAHALHGMYMKENKSEQHGFQHRLHKYVRNLHYTDPTGGEIYFNERRELSTDLILYSWIYHNTTDVQKVPISIFKGPDFVSETSLNISHHIFWKTGKVPVSRCSDPCLPGRRKKLGFSVHKCCYVCVSCSEGEISSISGSICIC
ncbi:vomeronasal type-2 receptor 116-like [Lithobates pipiens]